MSYKDEFPDYTTSDMPTIPTGFEDASWHNDVLPSWIHGKAHLGLYIAHSDKGRREYADCPRFQLYALDDENQITDDPALLATDDWNKMAVLIVRLTGEEGII